MKNLNNKNTVYRLIRGNAKKRLDSLIVPGSYKLETNGGFDSRAVSEETNILKDSKSLEELGNTQGENTSFMPPYLGGFVTINNSKDADNKDEVLKDHKKIMQLENEVYELKLKVNQINNIEDMENHLIKLSVGAMEQATLIDDFHEKAKRGIDNIESLLSHQANKGLGMHYENQWKRSSDGYALGGWLIAMGLIITATAAFYLYFVFADVPFSRDKLAMRLSILPISLFSVWFCAAQYNKQKSIIEDYAHKKVLSLSLLSFKSEVKDADPQYLEIYFKSIFGSLHKSPLESFDKKGSKSEVELLTDLVKDVLSRN